LKAFVLPFLLFATVGNERQQLPVIAIDSCVDVDAEEVRRLAALELGSSRVSADVTRLDVAVRCTDRAQELTVTDRTTGAVTVRSIDLTAQLETDRDATARELALAIAEVVRRADPQREPPPPPAAPGESRSMPTPTDHAAPASTPRSWRAELGVSGVFTRWTGGEVLLGVDATSRLRFGDSLITELRLGGRKTRPLELRSGGLDAGGVSASAGVSLDLLPYVAAGGVAVGVRFGADWLRYTAVDEQGAAYAGADVRAFSTSATATAFIEVAGPVSVTADAAVGTALHSVGIRDDGRTVSGMRGILLSGALGLGAHF
jgi:hypothetical protein